MSYVVKERIGLPIWEDEFVKGIKHYMPGSTVTDSDFEEARQDEDEKAMLLSYNTYTPEQWSAKQRIDEMEPQLASLQAQADDLLQIDYQNMTFSVADENQDAFEQVQLSIKKLEDERRQLKEVLDS